MLQVKNVEENYPGVCETILRIKAKEQGMAGTTE
jgi:hypothetical protein